MKRIEENKMKQDFTTYSTKALVRLARILKLTIAVHDQSELSASWPLSLVEVMAELNKRGVQNV